jgi:hypothetical protein
MQPGGVAEHAICGEAEQDDDRSAAPAAPERDPFGPPPPHQ